MQCSLVSRNAMLVSGGAEFAAIPVSERNQQQKYDSFEVSRINPAVRAAIWFMCFPAIPLLWRSHVADLYAALRIIEFS
jgi:hypothetical protein